MSDLWYDSIGFAAMKLIRRIVGVSHVADLEVRRSYKPVYLSTFLTYRLPLCEQSIEDADVRSMCEIKCLKIARICALQSHSRGGGGGVAALGSIEALAAAARAEYDAPVENADKIFLISR